MTDKDELLMTPEIKKRMGMTLSTPEWLEWCHSRLPDGVVALVRDDQARVEFEALLEDGPHVDDLELTGRQAGLLFRHLTVESVAAGPASAQWQFAGGLILRYEHPEERGRFLLSVAP